jgi:hypothetical protein
MAHRARFDIVFPAALAALVGLGATGCGGSGKPSGTVSGVSGASTGGATGGGTTGGGSIGGGSTTAGTTTGGSTTAGTTTAGTTTGGATTGITTGGFTTGGTTGTTTGGTTTGGTTGGTPGVYFQEDFEGATPKFVPNFGGGNQWWVGSPTFGPGAAHGGTKCAAVTFTASYVTGASALAATTPFSIPSSATKPILVLFSAFDIVPEQDGGNVLVQPQGGLLVSIDPFLGYSRMIMSALGDAGFTGDTKNGQQKPQWLEERFDLTPFIGQTIQIVFNFASNSTSSTVPGWFIDDVKVAEETITGPLSSPFPATPAVSDNFDGPNSLFVAQPPAGRSTDWEVQKTPQSNIGPGIAFSGAQCAGTNITFVDPGSSGGARYGDNVDPPDRLVTNLHVDLTGANQAVLVFEQYYDLEATYDGGRVVVAKDKSTGPWTPVDPRDGYPVQIVVGTGNTALGGQLAFSGRMNAQAAKDGWHRCSVDLTPVLTNAAIGPVFFLGFEFASDSSNFSPFAGWYIDDVQIFTK